MSQAPSDELSNSVSKLVELNKQITEANEDIKVLRQAEKALKLQVKKLMLDNGLDVVNLKKGKISVRRSSRKQGLNKASVKDGLTTYFNGNEAQAESCLKVILENLPTKESDISSKPLSPYAASKISAELLTYNYHYHFGLNTAILRFFTVYGPFGRPDMVIFKFLKSILDNTPITIYGDGEQTRDFTYVSDVSKALILSTNIKGHNIFNVGSGQSISVNKLIEIIEEYLNKKAIKEYIERDPSDIGHSLADTTRIKNNLNWDAKTDIEKGIIQTCEWFIKNIEFISSIKIQD